MQRGLARDVAAGGAFGIGAAEHHVLDFVRRQTGAPDRLDEHVAAHGGAVRHVQRALPGFRQARAGAGYDDGVLHGLSGMRHVLSTSIAGLCCPRKRL
jgi:hypothetical protein